jgi:GntR family transcriptional repressor for pyruvate dehydrogenase complex
MPTLDGGQVRIQKTHEVVAERLRRQIVRGQLQIGERLPPEEELTATYGIARTTLREALRVLESQGLITIRRGRGGGPVVTAPDLAPLSQALAVTLQLEGATFGDLDDARQLMESRVAARLAKEHSEEDIVALRAAVAEASHAAEANDAAAFGVAAARFHGTLTDRSSNQTIATLSSLLQQLVDTYYRAGAAIAGQRDMRRACRSYTKLIDLIVEGDAESADRHWHEHMSYTASGIGRDQPLDMYRSA